MTLLERKAAMFDLIEKNKLVITFLGASWFVVIEDGPFEGAAWEIPAEVGLLSALERIGEKLREKETGA